MRAGKRAMCHAQYFRFFRRERESRGLLGGAEGRVCLGYTFTAKFGSKLESIALPEFLQGYDSRLHRIPGEKFMLERAADH